MVTRKTIITVCLILLVFIVAVAYYLGSVKGRSSSLNTFEQKQECQKLGSLYESKLKEKQYDDLYLYKEFIRITYKYSEKYDTCVLLYSYFQYVDQRNTAEGGGFIIDLLENKELASYVDFKDETGVYVLDPQKEFYTKTEVEYFRDE